MKSNGKIWVAWVVIVIILVAVWFVRERRPSEVTATYPEGWLVSTSTSPEVTFYYPPDLGTTYIQEVDWPPQLQVLEESYTCTEAGDETGRAGRTQMQTVGGKQYCVTQVSEGAAGTIYTQYAYAFPMDSKTYILTFTVRSPQCLNYPEPQSSECQTESDSFDIGEVVNEIVGTFR